MVFHLMLREPDWEIIAWKNTLGVHEFNGYVRAVIAAERIRKIAVLPVPEHLEKVAGRYDTKLYFRGKEEVTLLRTIPKGKRSAVIKQILLKHIRANQRRMVSEKTDSPVKESVYEDGMSEEYRKMLAQMAGKA